MAAKGSGAGKRKTSRAELGGFLAAKRAKLRPDPSQLFKGARRRVPGLRREEVAERAGVSATWYAWLEQGRDISPSAAALRRIGRALELQGSDLRYLFRLAGTPFPKARKEALAAPFPPALARALQAMPMPVVVLDAELRPVRWNAPFRERILDLDGAPPRSWLEIMFLDPRVRASLEDWSSHIKRFVAEFRDWAGPRAGDPGVAALVERLAGHSPEFARAWKAYEAIGERKALAFVVRDPALGRLEFERTVFVPVEAPGLWVMVFTPAAG